MIRLSANVLYESSRMLSLIEEFSFSSINEIKYLANESIDPSSIFDFICECNWVINESDAPILTNRGKEINKYKDKIYYDEKLRIMLKDYIFVSRPIWMYRIPYGRKEASTFMTKDELMCFNEANLLGDDPSLSAVDWWDDISSTIRSEANLKLNETGRDGEKLTLKYEENRVKRKPTWQSIDSNLSGFDVISFISESSDERLFIEVKSTINSIKSAYFHISENEWKVANSINNYLIYLWVINDESPELAIIDTDDLLIHIPTNNEAGKWESAEIPFEIFRDKFRKVRMEEII